MRIQRRVSAGLWYAVAGLAAGITVTWQTVRPARNIYTVDNVSNELIWYCGLYPVCVFVCACLVAEDYKRSADKIKLSNWVWRGVLTTLACNILMAALLVGADALRGVKSGQQSSDPTDVYSPFSYFVFIIAVSFLLLGWLEALIGAGVGWLLGVRRQRQCRLSSMDESVRPAGNQRRAGRP